MVSSELYAVTLKSLNMWLNLELLSNCSIMLEWWVILHPISTGWKTASRMYYCMRWRWWKRRLGGLVENNEYNVVILFMRGIPAIPCAYPTRRILCFNMHPGKKKLCFLSRESPLQFAAGQHDSQLNSLMIALQVEKSQKNILPKVRGDAECQERAEEFSNHYLNTQPWPPLTLVCEYHKMGSL